MVPTLPALAQPPVPEYIGVYLDGRAVGFVESRRAAKLVSRLRQNKAARLAADEGLPVPPNQAPLQVCTEVLLDNEWAVMQGLATCFVLTHV